MQTIRSGRLRAGFPLPPPRAGRLEFGLDGLHDVRGLVADRAAGAGLSPRRTSDLAAAASELAANSVLHGGGRGLATVWEETGALLVEVADAGTIVDPTVGQVRPDPTSEHGRGLYIAGRLCDELAIDSGPSGTRIRLRMEIETG
ncbi:MAG TPA: ATP-binding protein [Solirubrobacterales bacterium]|jgi:anti-sigma regulatory factor (Ser/Thr protein kinase)|nr:ATP-binding protein [Solirubrobacterales bacterium]